MSWKAGSTVSVYCRRVGIFPGTAPCTTRRRVRSKSSILCIRRPATSPSWVAFVQRTTRRYVRHRYQMNIATDVKLRYDQRPDFTITTERCVVGRRCTSVSRPPVMTTSWLILDHENLLVSTVWRKLGKKCYSSEDTKFFFGDCSILLEHTGHPVFTRRIEYRGILCQSLVKG